MGCRNGLSAQPVKMKLVCFQLLGVLQTTQFLSLGTYATKCFEMFDLDTAIVSSCYVFSSVCKASKVYGLLQRSSASCSLNFLNAFRFIFPSRVRV